MPRTSGTCCAVSRMRSDCLSSEKTLLFFDEMAAIFDGTVATGAHAKSTGMLRAECENDEPNADESDELQNENSSTNLNVTRQPQQSSVPSSTSTSVNHTAPDGHRQPLQPKRQSFTPCPSTKKRRSSNTTDYNDGLLALAESQAKMANAKIATKLKKEEAVLDFQKQFPHLTPGNSFKFIKHLMSSVDAAEMYLVLSESLKQLMVDEYLAENQSFSELLHDNRSGYEETESVFGNIVDGNRSGNIGGRGSDNWDE